MKTKKFFEDYKELCKHSGQFYKDHWLVTLVFTTVGMVLSTSYLWVPVLKEKIEDHKMSKCQEEES